MADSRLTPEARRRKAAFRVMEQFADGEGFPLGEVSETDRGNRVDLKCKSPAGREFEIGYLKDAANA